MLDLSCGGWDGWHFGPYGKARKWRLFAPTSEFFIPAEILAIRESQLELDYLRLRIKTLEATKSLTLTAEDVFVIRALQRLLERLSVLPTDSSQNVASSGLPGFAGQLLDFKKALVG